ncbi:MAG TPA: hypothetical protein VJQ83_09475, partial [Tepidiformaceae bacterium]|nr:hypothetical protein [Tepidiformaceae bacterium]
DGAELALGVLNNAENPVVLVVDRVTAGKGRLLHYYFGEGRRHVVAEVGEFRLRGDLRTHWQDGERRWEIQLRAAQLDVHPSAPPAAARPAPSRIA